MHWPRYMMGIAGLLGASALMLAAMAAHTSGLDAASSAIVERAAFYQLIHALLLVVLALHYRPAWRITMLCILIGVICFCGSIYLHHLLQLKLPVPLAPIGGVSLMLGWLSLGVSALRR